MLIFILDIFECSKDTHTLVKAKANGPNYKHRVWALACISPSFALTSCTMTNTTTTSYISFYFTPFLHKQADQ